VNRFPLLIAAFLVMAGCSNEPEEDGLPPNVVLQILGARGQPTIRSSGDPPGPTASCGYARGDGPWRVSLSVTDPGGVRSYGLRLFTGEADFVDVAPAPPLSTTSTPVVGLTNVYQVTIADGADGTVTTPTLALFDIRGELPMSVIAVARDRSGRGAETFEFTLRTSGSSIICGDGA